MHALLQEILDEVRPLLGQGRVASYIPALADVAPDQLGIAVCSADGELFQAGDAQTPFSIQSISKVFSLVQAIGHRGESLWERLGHEPPGSRSIRWCSWNSNAAVRAIRSSTPARW
ncbi:glutaminase [Pseudomonas sp. BAY1663]|nr:glutaminase [Pseudomonas sp. BAY1663]